MKQFYTKSKRTRNSSFFIYIRKAKNCEKKKLKKIPKKY